MKHLHKDESCIVFELLLTAVMAIIIFFAMLNIGAFINGTVSTSLTGTYADNTPSGTTSGDYWKNDSATGYKNYSLPCTLAYLDEENTYVEITTNGSDITYDIIVNGVKVVDAASLTDPESAAYYLDDWDGVSLTDNYLNVSWVVNESDNLIEIHYEGTYYLDSDYRSNIENNTFDSMNALQGGFDSNLSIMIVAAIITIITIPLAAVIAIKRLI